MAEIVLGLGTSHSPQMNTPVEQWDLHAERDRSNPELWFRGRAYQFDELETEMLAMHPGLAAELEPSTWADQLARAHAATARLKGALSQAAPDVVVIVANDHREMLEVNLPSLSIYWGDSIDSIPIPEEEVPESIRPALKARQKEFVESYPCVPDLGLHLIESFTQEHFDVAEISVQPAGKGIGHGFTHIRLLLMDDPIPMVPVIINSYYPPNQPTATRCIEFGQALERAISAWRDPRRVAVVASGGLSHFVVDEEWDRRVLDALGARDWATIAKIRDEEMMQGTAEVRHWIAAGAALADLEMEVVDYIPAYRSTAGTGCGLGFALWTAGEKRGI